jgi:hypothetical protein
MNKIFLIRKLIFQNLKHQQTIHEKCVGWKSFRCWSHKSSLYSTTLNTQFNSTHFHMKIMYRKVKKKLKSGRESRWKFAVSHKLRENLLRACNLTIFMNKQNFRWKVWWRMKKKNQFSACFYKKQPHKISIKSSWILWIMWVSERERVSPTQIIFYLFLIPLLKKKIKNEKIWIWILIFS